MNWRLHQTLPATDDPLQDLVDPVKRAALDPGALLEISDAVGQAMHVAFGVGVVIAVAALIAGRSLPRGMKPEMVRRGAATA